MKRPYKVSKLGGGSRRFAHLDSAIIFARTQARASWALEDWTVWNATVPTDEPEWINGVPNPRWKFGVCVRIVPAEGPAYDPYARPLEVTLAPGEYHPRP